jgi:hypothetical protein
MEGIGLAVVMRTAACYYPLAACARKLPSKPGYSFIYRKGK